MKNNDQLSKQPFLLYFNLRLISFIIILGALSSCGGPQALPLVKGDELRITSKANNIQKSELIYDEIDAEDIVLKNMALENEPTFGIPISSLDNLKVKRGTKNHFLTGLGLGTLVGSISGAILAPQCSEYDFFCGLDQAGYVATGMIIGAVSGTIIGLIAKSDRWKKVPLDNIRLTTMPNSSGAIGVGLTINF